jgi:hypothetical protein
MLGVIAHSLMDVANISVLILLFLFCFLLIGMELYAFKLAKIDELDLLKLKH